MLLFLYFVFTDASEVKNGFSLLNIQNFNSSSESVDEIINVLNFNSNFSRDVLNGKITVNIMLLFRYFLLYLPQHDLPSLPRDPS